MTIQEAIVDRLEDIAAVTALVGTRIYASRLPQRGVLPAIRVQVISRMQPTHLRGASGLSRSRVQVDAVAGEQFTPDPSTQAHAVADALHGPGDGSALCGWSGVVGSPGIEILAILPLDEHEMYDAEEIRQYKVMRDYYVWWKAR